MTTPFRARGSESRIMWVLTGPFDTRRARAVAFWHYVIRRWATEICRTCGGRVGRATGSWWRADDALWAEVVGAPNAVLCPRCFTEAADRRGIPVRWEAVRDV